MEEASEPVGERRGRRTAAREREREGEGGRGRGKEGGRRERRDGGRVTAAGSCRLVYEHLSAPHRCEEWPAKMPNIRVAVRVRPLSERERARDSHPCIMVQEGTQVRSDEPAPTSTHACDPAFCYSKPSDSGRFAVVTRLRCTQINVVDPDDKMGGIDYLRLDKNRDKAYAFDAALDDTITQQEVFEITTKNSIPGVVKGTCLPNTSPCTPPRVDD